MSDLATLADVKAWLSTGERALGPRDDAMMARLITSASSFIESWLARPIGLAHWREIRDGPGGERGYRMQLAVTPVVDVDLLNICGRQIANVPLVPTQQMSLNQVGYFFDATSVILRGDRFQRGIGNVIVEYTAGYDPIPGDIEQACIEMVVRKYRERTRIGETSRSLGGAETVAYSTVMFSRRDMGTDIEALLWQYRQAAPIMRATLIPPPPVPFSLEDTQTIIELEDDTTPIVTEP
jgi:hypothetical protein